MTGLVTIAVAFLASSAVFGIEAAEPPTYYVDESSPNPTSPYTSWATAATSIQEAIDAGTEPGRLVLVTNGVYQAGKAQAEGWNRAVLLEAAQVRSVNGPDVTVIDGAKSVRCAYLGAGAVLSGFTLRNGRAEEGGGAYCHRTAVVTNCLFIDNAAEVGGGACGGTLEACVLTANTAENSGGGASRSTLRDCRLTGNDAESGGGVDNSVLRSCVLTDNTAQSDGGGAYESTLDNCLLSGNTAAWSGGGAYGGTLSNCVLTGNTAGEGAGGAYWATLSNCTITKNSAPEVGGVADATLYNCLVYFNTAAGLPANHEACDFEYSCTTPLPPGSGNIDADPRLASATHLSMDSPCIGAGNAAYASGTDIDGEPWADPPCMGADQLVPGDAIGPLELRIEATYTNVAVGFAVEFVAHSTGRILSSVWDFVDGTMATNQAFGRHAWESPGLYTVTLTGINDSAPGGVKTMIEVQVSEATCYVNSANRTPVFPYTSWATAATNIQVALEAGVVSGRVVLVADGVYDSGEADAAGRNRVVLFGAAQVRSVNGPGVTVIDGGGSVRCAYVGSGAVLSGFTLRNGSAAEGGGAYADLHGMLTNCVLTGNVALAGGGAWGGTLDHCTITGNRATSTEWQGGGGGAAWARLYHCRVTDNEAVDGGGAKHSTLHNCFVVSNRANREGGGTAWSRLYNSLVTGNSADYGGGVMVGSLYHCTVTGNVATSCCGGTAGGGWMNPPGSVLFNCIVRFNQAPDAPDYAESMFEVSGSDPYYSCVTPLPEYYGVGNIDADPRFVDPANGDFRLRPDSPCIDAGTDLADVSVDLDGTPRPLDGNGDGIAGFDMGAFEFDPRSVPLLTVTLARDGLRLEWPTTVLGSGLQRTTTLTNPVWQDVPGSASVNSIVLPVADSTAFFRLVQP